MDKQEILAQETSADFWQKMQNAMLMSFHKYGPVRDAYPERIDAIASLSVRLRKYAETGNKEYLVDVANFAMIEFMFPRHPQAHYTAEPSTASPGRVSLVDGRLSHEDNSGNNLKPALANTSSVANMREMLRTRGIGGDN